MRMLEVLPKGEFMREARFRDVVARLVYAAIVLLIAAKSGKTQSISASNADLPQVPAYVSDFELVAHATNAPPAPSLPAQGNTNSARKPDGAAGAGNTPPPAQPIVAETDPPYVQARKIQDFFANTLTQFLQKSGFPARRQEGGRPEYGVQMRGIFAEVDPMNRVRKAILGSPSSSGKFVLYVATYNLARPDQPLYLLAPVQDHDQRYGPIISMNSYVPMEKYELSKDPTEEDVRNICGQIVNNLVQLIKRNVVAFEH